jgi:thiosulfate/3-mercaptopyruvate sulfurtransferase
MQPIVSPQWLLENLGQENLVLADCRFNLTDPAAGDRLYKTSHIPGAYYFDLNRDLSSPVQVHGGRHPLPDVATLSAKLRSVGVCSQPEPTLIVAYDDSRFAFAARFWWLLRYLGHERVVILDGGFSAWQAAGYPVTDAISINRSGDFSPQPQPDRVVDIETVRARKDLPTVALVDAREGDRYRGKREPIDPIAGHIPGAVNYPWQAVTDENGWVRSPTEQQQRWQELAATDEILVYCGSGVTACVILLSLAIAGRIEGAKLYAGSWSDWCSYMEP